MGAPTTDRGGVIQALRALSAAGWKPVGVQSVGEEREPVANTWQAAQAVMDLDDAFVVVSNGERESWVRFVMGNEPDEVVCDYLTSLSPVLDPLLEGWSA